MNEFKKEDCIVKLAPRKIKMVVQDLNQVLDSHTIYGAEFNKEVILALIQSNLSRTQTADLIKRIEEAPMSDWND